VTSNKTLKSWSPGQSGNPKGRPVGSLNVASGINKRLQKHPEEVEKTIDNSNRFIEILGSNL